MTKLIYGKLATTLAGSYVVAALLLTLPIPILAQDSENSAPAIPELPGRISIGTKVWSVAWNSWTTSRTGTGVALGTGRYQTVQSVNSSDQIAAIPFLSYSIDDFYVTTSVMTKTHFDLTDAASPNGFLVRAARQEFDLSSGYYVMPHRMAPYIGYKQLAQYYGNDKYRWRGLLVGLAGSAPLGDQFADWSAYANVAAGLMRAQFADSQADITGRTNFRSNYRLGEFGLAYSLSSPASWINSIKLTLGYRAQFVNTKNYALSVTDTSGKSTYNLSSDLRDTTQGFVFGLSAAF